MCVYMNTDICIESASLCVLVCVREERVLLLSQSRGSGQLSQRLALLYAPILLGPMSSLIDCIIGRACQPELVPIPTSAERTASLVAGQP
jgi:hypothetical protein